MDDFLHCGNHEFNSVVIESVSNTFLVGKREKGCFLYTGFSISQTKHSITIDQNQYVMNIDIPEVDLGRSTDKKSPLTACEKSNLRKMAGTLNWLVHGTRPDKSFELILASTKFQQGSMEDLLRIKKVLSYMKEGKAELVIPDLGAPEHWRILCFTDASLGNLNEGKDSTAGHLVLLWNYVTQ